jgi:hypothetical protein
MSQATLPIRTQGFGATQRRDAWWAEPLITLTVLMSFVIYGNLAVFWPFLFGKPYFEVRQNADFTGREIAPYLTPFYAPLIFDSQSSHAWIQSDRPSWWPSWAPFSSALLILIFPLGFRFTCYYYRKAYYRSFWADPPACGVGEPRKSYWGENHWPLLIQNLHRYFLYFAIIFVFLLGWDALKAFWWPTDSSGNLLTEGKGQFGMGLGTVLLVINVVLIAAYTFGCHSFRHLIGGRLNCFNCVKNGELQPTTRFKLWRQVTRLNDHHMFWAWVSMLWIGFTDLYLRLCAMHVMKDPRFF